MEDELKERVKILQAQLELAIQQRNGFAKNYHEVCKIPFQERYEVIQDCDQEIEELKHK